MVLIEQYRVKPELFENPLLSIHLKGMRLFGYIIGTNQRHQMWHFVRCTFFSFSFVAFFVLNFVRVLRSIHILDADFILRPTTVVLFSFAIHVMNAYFQRNRVVRLLNFLHEDLILIRSCNDDWEDEVYEKLVQYCRRITLVLLIPSVIDVGLACLQCFLETILDPDLIYQQVLAPEKLNGSAKSIILLDSYPFGEALGIFSLGYIGSYYGIVLTVFTLNLLHTLSACLMKFMIFKIDILNKRLSEMNITKISSSVNGRGMTNDESYEDWHNLMLLKMCEYCVKEQIKIRWFVREMEKFLRFPLFMDFFLFSVLLCVLLYPISIGGLTKMEYFFTVIFISVMTGIQLLYHWHATLLTKKHETMRDSIYSCDWYTYSVQVQKTIRVILMDSNRPLIMSAFIMELKLETLFEIFRGAFSYFSILSNYNK